MGCGATKHNADSAHGSKGKHAPSIAQTLPVQPSVFPEVGSVPGELSPNGEIPAIVVNAPHDSVLLLIDPKRPTLTDFFDPKASVELEELAEMPELKAFGPLNLPSKRVCLALDAAMPLTVKALLQTSLLKLLPHENTHFCILSPTESTPAQYAGAGFCYTVLYSIFSLLPATAAVTIVDREFLPLVTSKARGQRGAEVANMNKMVVSSLIMRETKGGTSFYPDGFRTAVSFRNFLVNADQTLFERKAFWDTVIDMGIDEASVEKGRQRLRTRLGSINAGSFSYVPAPNLGSLSTPSPAKSSRKVLAVVGGILAEEAAKGLEQTAGGVREVIRRAEAAEDTETILEEEEMLMIVDATAQAEAHAAATSRAVSAVRRGPADGRLLAVLLLVPDTLSALWTVAPLLAACAEHADLVFLCAGDSVDRAVSALQPLFDPSRLVSFSHLGNHMRPLPSLKFSVFATRDAGAAGVCVPVEMGKGLSGTLVSASFGGSLGVNGEKVLRCIVSAEEVKKSEVEVGVSDGAVSVRGFKDAGGFSGGERGWGGARGVNAALEREGGAMELAMVPHPEMVFEGGESTGVSVGMVIALGVLIELFGRVVSDLSADSEGNVTPSLQTKRDVLKQLEGVEDLDIEEWVAVLSDHLLELRGWEEEGRGE
uniref:Uncharacterized protein n=1 Tax=Chromera velia CCMP2878 TaxID=1169474 RepID=A0A0G4GP67_9ALVE|eukprot:Cvel_22758.t1-p1 / transcript=Cvel_22758.t1 / gene=Cvel_22758 / organism=Chromera_velia_CCMP2878 / gene_product=hypothetical protein / transcript_product=hypothetical protein / location=Cvel_scaffold2272:10775-13642(-) / protein_length=653 / sequence_SO=supercontig / SO=protein_coding / is_pseudo=false